MGGGGPCGPSARNAPGLVSKTDVNSANIYTTNLSPQILISNEQLGAVFPIDSIAFWFWFGQGRCCLNRLKGEIRKGQLFRLILKAKMIVGFE